MKSKTAEIAKVRQMALSGEARAVRQRSRISRSEVASELGVHEATVARWESGERLPRGPMAIRWGQLLERLVEVVG